MNEINKISVGEYSNIISTAGGNIILKLNDKRKKSVEIDKRKRLKNLLDLRKIIIY